jgi:hypothetical protein
VTKRRSLDGGTTTVTRWSPNSRSRALAMRVIMSIAGHVSCAHAAPGLPRADGSEAARPRRTRPSEVRSLLNNLTVTCGRYHATVCVIGRWHGNPKQRPEQQRPEQPRSHRRSDMLYHRQRLPPSAPQSSRGLTDGACRRRPCSGSKRQSRTVEQQASAKWSMHQVGSADGETPSRQSGCGSPMPAASPRPVNYGALLPSGTAGNAPGAWRDYAADPFHSARRDMAYCPSGLSRGGD